MASMDVDGTHTDAEPVQYGAELRRPRQGTVGQIIYLQRELLGRRV